MSEMNVEKTETNDGMGPVALALTVLPTSFGVLLLLYLTPLLHAGFFPQVSREAEAQKLEKHDTLYAIYH